MGNSKIAEKLGALLKLCDLKQAELSVDADVSYSAINRYLTGKSDLRSETFLKLLKAAGIDLNEIIVEKINEKVGIKKQDPSIGSKIAAVIESLEQIEQKTILDTIIVKSENSPNHGVKSEINHLKSYRQDIACMRRQ